VVEPDSGGTKLPHPSGAVVKFAPDTSAADIKAAKAAMTKMFGEKFTLQDFASAAGAPDHAKVIIDYDAQFHNIPAKFTVYVKAPELEDMTRSFSVDARGRKIIKNVIFVAKETGTGLGLNLFSRQVENAAALGFRTIKTEAARGEIFNGYSTWPKFGYNAKLEHNIRDQLEHAGLGRPRSMHELRKTEAGRNWWNEHGNSINMQFNLAPNSRSRRILRKYAADRASRPPRTSPSS
jgi:hypothetical protein